jgi:hypothetical protein
MPNLAQGADMVSGDRYAFQQYNRNKNNYRGTVEPTSIQPGMLFSKSSTETLYHSQAASRKVILQETDCMIYADSKLIGVLAANMNPAGGTPVMAVLYTVPAGKSCIITKVIIRNSSGNLTTASISFGFDANGSDVIADGTRTYLDGATKYGLIPPVNGAVVGIAAGTFKVAVNTKQGAAMTIDIDVFGYLF